MHTSLRKTLYNDKLSCSDGGDVRKELRVDYRDGTTTTEGQSRITIGNSIAIGKDKNSTGVLRLCSATNYVADLIMANLTNNRVITFQNKTGTVALTSDIPSVPNIYVFTTTFDSTNVSKQYNSSGNVNQYSVVIGFHVGGYLFGGGQVMAAGISSIVYDGSGKFTITRTDAGAFAGQDVSIIFMKTQ